MESAGTRIFHEAGARVATNVLVRDLDLLVPKCGRREALGDCGQSIERRRVTPSQRCRERRCASPGCQAPQSAHMSRVGGTTCASSVGRLGWRSRSALVW